MKDSLLLNFLYNTLPGRLLLRPLVGKHVSMLAGRLLSLKSSCVIIPFFVRKHKISMKGINIPEKGFSSFNDFFTRRKTDPIPVFGEEFLISPCEGFLTVTDIKNDSVFNIKGTVFTLQSLLKNEELSGRFKGGRALIFRLTPANYHRYCYPADGEIIMERRIEGKYHCVRPVALRKVPVFVENTREYQVIRTKRFKDMVQMEVGAMLVGRINNNMHPPGDGRVAAGEEKGCFEFGGSTIILLFQKDALRLRKSLISSEKCSEIPVKIGEVIAKTIFL